MGFLNPWWSIMSCWKDFWCDCNTLWSWSWRTRSNNFVQDCVIDICICDSFFYGKWLDFCCRGRFIRRWRFLLWNLKNENIYITKRKETSRHFPGKKEFRFFPRILSTFLSNFFTVFHEWFFRNFFEFFFFQFFLNGSVCFGRFCFYRILSTSIVIEWYTCSFTRRTEKSPKKFKFLLKFKIPFKILTRQIEWSWLSRTKIEREWKVSSCPFCVWLTDAEDQ